MSADRLTQLLADLADRAEATGVEPDAEPCGALHKFVQRNCIMLPGQDFWIVTLLAAELADRDARREGYRDQIDRAAKRAAFHLTTRTSGI